MFNYRRATLEDLEKIWNKDIQDNLDDNRYIRWKEEFIKANEKNNIVTFVVLNDDDPVGQVSIVLNKNNIKVECRDMLCDGKDTAYLSTFRIEKPFEGQGHISNLVKLAENYAREINIKYLTIGSEAKESRNLAIYLHFGYNEFITFDNSEEELVLFYKKKL